MDVMIARSILTVSMMIIGWELGSRWERRRQARRETAAHWRARLAMRGIIPPGF